MRKLIKIIQKVCLQSEKYNLYLYNIKPVSFFLAQTINI